MTQQDIVSDQSLNKILDKITNKWKLSFQHDDKDYNSKKREAVEQIQQELEGNFFRVYQAKLLEINDFSQKEKLINDLILKIEELKISLKGSSQKYPDSNSIAYRELVCDSIKTKLLQEKEKLKKEEKLKWMDIQLEIIYPLSFDVEAKKDPLKNLLKSIIKPWKVEFFPSEFSQDKEDMLVENFIKDKKLRFLQDIKTLILGFSNDEISQTISLFQESKKLLSSFYSQDSQGYKIRNKLIDDILTALEYNKKTSEENDIKKPFQDYIDSIIKLKNQLYPNEQNPNKSPYSFVSRFLKDSIIQRNIINNEQNIYCKMCLFYYSALTLSQSLKGSNQDGSPSQEELVSDLCMSYDQFNDVLTDQEKEIFKRSVVENFSIKDINRLIDKFQQELTKSNENQQESTIYPRNPETLENILTRLEYFKEYLERELGAEIKIEAENNLNYQLYTILSREIINPISKTKFTQQKNEKDLNRYLDLIIIEDPNTKAQLNKDFTLEDLHFLRLKCLTSEILNTQNTEKLNSIIVNKIEDFLLYHYKDFNSECKQETYFNNKNLHLKLLLANDQIMDKFVEKLKINSELNSKILSILSTNSLENPDSLKTILLEAIRRKYSATHEIKPNQSMALAKSSPENLQNTSKLSSVAMG